MDLVVTVRFNAPAPLAFKALTSSDGLDQFWTEKSDVDARAGGQFLFWYEDAEAPEPEAWGTFLRFEDQRLIQLSFGEGDESPVTVRFHPNERGGTDVELVQENLPEDDEEALEALYDGWEEVLAGAKEVAERWRAKAVKAAKAEKDARDARPTRGRRR